MGMVACGNKAENTEATEAPAEEVVEEVVVAEPTDSAAVVADSAAVEAPAGEAAAQ